MFQAIAAFSGFSVKDITKAREFYVDKLGLKLLDDKMGLQLELPGGGQAFIYEKPDHWPATFTILNFVVEDIDKTVDFLASQKGIQFEHYEALTTQDEKGIARGKSVN